MVGQKEIENIWAHRSFDVMDEPQQMALESCGAAVNTC
jgi:hypothetical protein